MAHARVISHPNEDLEAPDLEYRWRFDLKNVRIYLDKPVKVDLGVRSRLDRFRGRDPNHWAWFVQATRRLTVNDFKLLTRGHS